MGISPCCRNSSKIDEGAIPASLKKKKESSLESFSLYNNFLRTLTDNKYYLHIHISELELYYKHWDNFGLVFHPMITLSIPSKNKQFITLPGDVKDKMNLSNVSRNSNSSSNTSMNTMDMTSTVLGMNNNSEYKKTFYFDYDKTFTLNKGTFFDYINITIQNEAWTSKQESLCIIGEGKIPIDLITNTKGDNIFGGLMAINHRGIGSLGQLSVNIDITSLGNFNEEKGGNSDKVLLNIEDDNKHEENEPRDQNLNIKYPYEDNVLHFYHVRNHQLLRDFDITNEESIEAAIAFILESQKSDEIDKKFLSQQYEAFLTNSNFLIGYELFIYLLRNINNPEQGEEVYDLIEIISIEKLIEFPDHCEYNLIILKAFLVFLCRYIKYCRKNNSLDDKTQSILMTILVKLIKHKLLNNESVIEEEKEKVSNKEINMSDFNTRILYDNCQYCLNAICDSITYSKNQQLNFKISYDFCIIIIENLKIFSLYIGNFITNSEIVFTVIRLFRKVLQIISNETEIIKTNKSHPTISVELKQKIINSQSEIIKHISLVIKYYYHIPELMSNILQILVELSSNVPKEYLNDLYDQMDFDLFSQKFLYYRSKLKYINKSLNQLYLELLNNFSQMIRDDNFEDIEHILSKNTSTVETIKGINVLSTDKHESLAKEVLFFYQMTKKYSGFLNKKNQFIYLNELMSNIGYNLCLMNKTAYMLTNCFFYNDCVGFLIRLSDSKTNNNFIDSAIDKNIKTIGIDGVKDCIKNTIENIMRILLITLLSSENDIAVKVKDNLVNCKETEEFFSDFRRIRESIRKCLEERGVVVETIEMLFDLFEMYYIQVENDNISNGFKEDGKSTKRKVIKIDSKDKISKKSERSKKTKGSKQSDSIKKKTSLPLKETNDLVGKKEEIKEEKQEEEEEDEEDEEYEEGEEGEEENEEGEFEDGEEDEEEEEESKKQKTKIM